MNSDFDMKGILSRNPECPSCGADQAPGVTRCAACGAAIASEEEESVSLLSEGPRSAGSLEKTPLEQSKNFLLIRRSAAGIGDGTLGEEAYRQNVSKLRIMAETALKLYDTDVMKKKFVEASPEEQNLNMELKGCFERLHHGVLRMESFLKSHRADDAREGAAEAEAAFVDMDRIQDRAAILPGASEA